MLMRKKLLLSVFVVLILGLAFVNTSTTLATEELPDIDTFFEQFWSKWMKVALSSFETCLVNDEEFDFFDIDIMLTRFSKETLLVLEKYDPTQFTPDQYISYEILKRYLTNWIENSMYRIFEYPLTSNNPTFQFVVDEYYNINITDKESAKLYIKGLKQFPQIFNRFMKNIISYEKRGIIPPSYSIEEYIVETKQYINEEITEIPEHNNFYLYFKDSVNGLTNLTEEEKNQLYAEALEAIGSNFFNQAQELIAYLEKLKGISQTQAGVWQLPGGEGYYAHVLKKHIATNLTPYEVHEIGLKEVAKIQAEMRPLLDELGYKNLSIHQALEELAKKEILTDPEAIETCYLEIIQNIKPKLSLMFNTLPDQDVQVRLRPLSNILACYGGGTLWVNPIAPQERYRMQAIAFHETNPGHHLQHSIRNQLSYYPQFRYIARCTAYTEGWALYAESLADEFGCYENLESRIGYLNQQLFRAARLVIDTGLHYKRWTREQATEYLSQTTGIIGIEAEEEIGRYILWPGQACAYKIGHIKMMELREKAQIALGERFDLREFHEVILGKGDMPLDLLEDEVEKYISRTLADMN